MALVIPLEAWEHPRVRSWLDGMLASNGPIRQVLPVDVRQSMANGGGPACLRLRVVADPTTVDPRFLLDSAKANRIEAVIAANWPEMIDPAELGSETLARKVVAARLALLETLDLSELA
jgi:succinylarginine dihydrolase